MAEYRNLIAGLSGAIALNLLHESLKNKGDDMPRVDLIGEEALNKGLSWFGKRIGSPDNLYRATLAGDVLTNTLYYSLIGVRVTQNLVLKGLVSGLSAGIGAVVLPGPMGLDDQPVTRTAKTKLLTIAYYLTGALVTSVILKALSKK